MSLPEALPFKVCLQRVRSQQQLSLRRSSQRSPLALLRDADNAMYEAKRSGRDQVVLFHNHARDVANRKWGVGTARAGRLSAS